MTKAQRKRILRKRITLSSTLVALFFMPGRIHHFKLIEQPTQMAGKHWAGDPILMRNPDAEMNYVLEGMRMSPTPNGASVFGVLPLYGPQYMTFAGYKRTSPTWWRAEVGEWYYQLLSVTRRGRDQAIDLRIPASIWKRLEDADEEKEKDKLFMQALYKRDDGTLPSFCFKTPLESRSASSFGSPRYLPDGHFYYHTGEDLRAITGTRIKAAGEGSVAFAGNMVVPGKSVVLYHGGGLFTRYLHLNEPKVKQGDTVKHGSLVGLSGGTGRVTAPHLHWEVVWKGRPANPTKFLKTWSQACR